MGFEFGSQQFKSALDSYITGGRYHKECHTLRCPKCEFTRDVDMECEYGGCWPINDDEVYCPDCDIEME